MSDIFISYAKANRAKAKLLADSLSQQGWSVWWDRNIPPGRSFDEVIEEALDSARCVIVLWSEEVVVLDGQRLYESKALFTTKLDFSFDFEIADGAETYPANIRFKYSDWKGRVGQVQLSVAGRTLYEESS